MVVEDSQTPNGHFKNTVLPFEGFMEAVCRVAAQKALPTKEELNAPEECGQWMVELRTTRATDYDEMLMQRATEWGSPPPADYPHTLECTIVLLAFEVRDSKIGRRYCLVDSTQGSAARPPRAGVEPWTTWRLPTGAGAARFGLSRAATGKFAFGDR
jgi:hypothetical protein